MKFAKELSPVALNGAISGEITVCFKEKIVQSSYYFQVSIDGPYLKKVATYLNKVQMILAVSH